MLPSLPHAANSLRTRLIFAFAAVITLSLLLASGSFVYLLRGYQADREKDRLDNLAGLTSVTVVRDLRAGLALPDLEAHLDQIASSSNTRILLLDSRGMVVHDTDQDSLDNSNVQLPDPDVRQPFRGMLPLPSNQTLYAVVAAIPPIGFRVAVVAPEQSLTDAWLGLLPQMIWAALGSLLVSVVIAWWLASTITRPISRITRASEDMAHGNFDQTLPVPRQPDEIGRLAAAFNAMATEVAHSHRAMRDLLANVSHDLRTPLTSIEGFAGALLDGTLSGPEGAREAGNVIREEAERMRRLVEDLLYLGRIESGDLMLERRTLDLADLAHAAGVRFTFRAEDALIDLSLDAPQPVYVSADQHRIAQVIDNLLDNAFKHTPRGGQITITAGRELPASGGAGARPGGQTMGYLRVHNSGSVIPPEDLDRVFERFYQVDRARASRGGRGLGLAIAREIVQAHGGSLGVQSGVGAGTAFTLRLPVIETGQRTNLSSPVEPARRVAASAAVSHD